MVSGLCNVLVNVSQKCNQGVVENCIVLQMIFCFFNDDWEIYFLFYLRVCVSYDIE